jgi:tocopherol O-methyltransferase
LREARRRSGRHCRWAQADAAALPFRSAVFDAAWIVECSEHVADLEGLFRECARIVRPGGVLALAAWLRSEETSAGALKEVEEGFLLTPLRTASECRSTLAVAGWEDVRWQDRTADVLRTWDICLEVTRQPMVQQLVRLQPEHVRRFVGAFGEIRRAYAEGQMQYGLFAARRGPP